MHNATVRPVASPKMLIKENVLSFVRYLNVVYKKLIMIIDFYTSISRQVQLQYLFPAVPDCM